MIEHNDFESLAWKCSFPSVMVTIILMSAFLPQKALSVNIDFNSIAVKGAFPKFCVDTYHWIDRTFNGADTSYVKSTGYKWNLKLRTNGWSDFNHFYFDKDNRMKMHSPFCGSIGADVQFMAVALGYDLNLNHLFGGKDRSKSKFNLDFSSGLLSARLYSIKNKDGMTISRFGDLKKQNIEYYGLKSTVWGIDITCFLNPRRYYGSATLSFGKIQIRSQGSWLVGLAYQSQKLNFDFTSLPDEVKPWLPEKWHGKTYTTDGYNIGLSGGYGYNWVPRRNLTLGMQAMVIPSLNYGYVNGDEKQYGFRINYRLNVGMFWNHNRWFIGAAAKVDASAIYSNSTLTNGLVNLEAKIGWRFNLF